MNVNQVIAWLGLMGMLILLGFRLERIQRVLEQQEERVQHIEAAVIPWPYWGPACR